MNFIIINYVSHGTLQDIIITQKNIILICNDSLFTES